MSMRMVPIQGVFQKMARLVRDLSHKAGKQVDFVTGGEETELDRTVVDKIADPLVHMVRNAVDHGIEPPDDRVKAGKSPPGVSSCGPSTRRAASSSRCRTTAKGLDKERILQEGGRAGPRASRARNCPRRKIFKLIFHPGLSTAEKVTDVSGRGVGMDVVKKNIEALRGRIDISSTAGQGHDLHDPPAADAGGHRRPGRAGRRAPATSCRPTPSCRACARRPSRSPACRTAARWSWCAGSSAARFACTSCSRSVRRTEDPTEALVVIVEDDGRKCCLLVDELLGQQQVVIKSLGRGAGTDPGRFRRRHHGRRHG